MNSGPRVSVLSSGANSKAEHVVLEISAYSSGSGRGCGRGGPTAPVRSLGRLRQTTIPAGTTAAECWAWHVKLFPFMASKLDFLFGREDIQNLGFGFFHLFLNLLKFGRSPPWPGRPNCGRFASRISSILFFCSSVMFSCLGDFVAGQSTCPLGLNLISLSRFFCSGVRTPSTLLVISLAALHLFAHRFASLFHGLAFGQGVDQRVHASTFAILR